MASVRLLGSLEYRTAEGEAVELGQARQRGIFAMLAVSANDVVMTSELIDWTWGSEPPRSARNMVHSYISRLRGALESPGDGPDDGVRRRHGGYVLQIDPHAIDLHRFRQVVAAARAGSADTRASVLLFREALGIWRGRALGGVTGPWAAKIRRLLALERLSVLVECHDGELRLGGHLGLLDELHALADEHPDNEIVIRNLMTALYRSGRQAEALGAYADLRRRLVDHLGVDPAGQTQELHTRILRADPELTLQPPRTTRGLPPTAHIPQQLPRGTRFIGREQELAVLDGFVAAADAGPPVRVIEGPPGTGKTALAIHWAHRVAHRFPDGQIFVDLHGSEGCQDDQPQDTVLRFVLWSLGVPVPAGGTAETVELYRTAVKDRRLLIVLDDLACHEQITALLPGASAGTVVATTRDPSCLARLETTQPIRCVRLRELSDRQAERMLAGILGETRVEAEPVAVARIIELCGRTPRALSAAAEHALGRPRLTLTDLAMTMGSGG